MWSFPNKHLKTWICSSFTDILELSRGGEQISCSDFQWKFFCECFHVISWQNGYYPTNLKECKMYMYIITVCLQLQYQESIILVEFCAHTGFLQNSEKTNDKKFISASTHSGEKLHNCLIHFSASHHHLLYFWITLCTVVKLITKLGCFSKLTASVDGGSNNFFLLCFFLCFHALLVPSMSKLHTAILTWAITYIFCSPGATCVFLP